jgi:uncharacterized protein (TIGR02453 family)
MNKRKIFDFLRDLRDNNDKAWMDEHRARYHEAKDIWLEEVALYLSRLARYDPQLEHLSPKKTIMRINNNNVFHPDKPTYKSHFGFDPYKGRNRPAFYLHISPDGCFLAGGLWHPDAESVKLLREAIDYDGEEVKKIVADPDFVAFYGGLDEDTDALKTSPKGYGKDHRHIDLLRRKNFTVLRELTQEEVTATGFVDTVEEGFVLMRPFLGYLRGALAFEA